MRTYLQKESLGRSREIDGGKAITREIERERVREIERQTETATDR